jgi:hypothetical protein
MDYQIGDAVSGKGIQLGRYQGQVSINDADYHKVLDVTRNAVHFIH